MQAKPYNIIMYSTPTCVYCHMAKEFFLANNVKYQEINVTLDHKAAQDMIKKSGPMGVPVIDKTAP